MSEPTSEHDQMVDEIDRLRAALKRAERERDGWRDNWQRACHERNDYMDKLAQQRAVVEDLKWDLAHAREDAAQMRTLAGERLASLRQKDAVVEALKTLYEYPPDCEACQEQRERGLHVFGYDVAKEFCMCEQHANEYRAAYDVAYPRPLTTPAAAETVEEVCVCGHRRDLHLGGSLGHICWERDGRCWSCDCLTFKGPHTGVEEMRSEYDIRGGERGKYLNRVTPNHPTTTNEGAAPTASASETETPAC